MERSVTDMVKIEVESLEHLNNIMLDLSLLDKIIHEQDKEWEEICGDCLDIGFEDDRNEYVIGEKEAIKRSYNEKTL